MTKAFLGTGLLGSAFVEAWRRRGVPVAVWNRTRSRADALAALGASVHDSPADAARGATHVHICVSDDAAVDAILDAIVPVLQEENGGSEAAFVVDHTTTSPKGALARYERARREGFRFVHAPVFMSPAAAREQKGMMLISGPRDESLEVELAAMTGELLHLGPREDLAACGKLFVNALILSLAGGVADVLAMARSLGVAGEEAVTLLSKFDPSAAIKIRGVRMAKGDFAASFELAMARKDLRLMLDAADPLPLSVLRGLAQRMDTLVARGHGRADVGVLAIDAIAPASSGSQAASGVIERLHGTHHRINQRIADLERALGEGDGNADARGALADAIAFSERGIARHEDDEELSLFPRANEIAAAAPIMARLVGEHAGQRALWKKLRDAETGPLRLAFVHELARSYREHARIEEEELFPLLVDALPDSVFRAIDDEMERRRGGGGGGGGRS